jgi:hypothetical protein
LVGLGCAVGPLVNHETARTVGKNEHELIGGYGVAGYVVKWNYGMKENLDLGFQYESFSIGLKLKYSFINSTEGLSLAAAIGTGWSAGGDHRYLDLMSSFKGERIEPYVTIRLVHVKTKPLDFRSSDSDTTLFTIEKSEYSYGQFLLGVRIPINERAFFSPEISTLFNVSSVSFARSGILYGLAIGAHLK